MPCSACPTRPGLVEFARGLVGARLRARVHRRHREGPGGGRPAGHPGVRGHRVPRDDGRPREDAAPGVHGGILARRDHADDLAALERHGIGPIDLVVVNLYPFARRRANPATPFDELVEEIDIGGPCWCARRPRTSATCWWSSSPADYAAVLADARSAGRAAARRSASSWRARRSRTRRLRHGHRRRRSSDVDGARRRVRPRGRERAGRCPRGSSSPPDKLRDLRYGENPHQPAAWYVPSRPRGCGCRAVLQGKELSFTNLLDLDAAARIVARVRRAGGGRHQAHESVRRGDGRRRSPTPTCARATPTRSPRSAASSGSTGRSTTRRPGPSSSTFIEAVIAPAVDDGGAARSSRRRRTCAS